MNNTMTIEAILHKQAERRKLKGPYPEAYQYVNAFGTSSIGMILKGLAKYADDYTGATPSLDDYWILSLKLVRGLLLGNIGPYFDAKFCLEIISALALKNGFSYSDLRFASCRKRSSRKVKDDCVSLNIP